MSTGLAARPVASCTTVRRWGTTSVASAGAPIRRLTATTARAVNQCVAGWPTGVPPPSARGMSSRANRFSTGGSKNLAASDGPMKPRRHRLVCRHGRAHPTEAHRQADRHSAGRRHRVSSSVATHGRRHKPHATHQARDDAVSDFRRGTGAQEPLVQQWEDVLQHHTKANYTLHAHHEARVSQR